MKLQVLKMSLIWTGFVPSGAVCSCCVRNSAQEQPVRCRSAEFTPVKQHRAAWQKQSISIAFFSGMYLLNWTWKLRGHFFIYSFFTFKIWNMNQLFEIPPHPRSLFSPSQTRWQDFSCNEALFILLQYNKYLGRALSYHPALTLWGMPPYRSPAQRRRESQLQGSEQQRAVIWGCPVSSGSLWENGWQSPLDSELSK